jgi:aspartate aminotransferase-like enzyme
MPAKSSDIIHLLPGPVELDKSVILEFNRSPVSHRSDEFRQDFQILRGRLCKLVNARNVEILSGSGTLANDAVAAQLSGLSEKGLILSNGEFGNRIISQATRFALDFHTFTIPWGEAFSIGEITDYLDQNGPVGWIWAVHSETSTGVLNRIDQLQELCLKRKMKLCLDCISSVGIVPVNLESVYLASCSSGKALCSYPGLSMVFHNHEIGVNSRVPKYLDLGYTESEEGIPFTISSNLVYALLKAVEALDSPGPVFAAIEQKSRMLREAIADKNLKIINDKSISSPAVITIELPRKVNSVEVGKLLAENGCFISYNSGYLVKKNWIQTFITRNTTALSISRFAEMISPGWTE